MSKITIILGKRIGQAKDFELDKLGLLLPLDRTIAVRRYPELGNPFVGFYVPLHPNDFIPQTMLDLTWYTEHGTDVQLWTMSEYLVNTIGGAIGLGVLNCQDVEVRLYADDNSGYTNHVFNEMGFLQEGWPFGWFMPSL